MYNFIYFLIYYYILSSLCRIRVWICFCIINSGIVGYVRLSSSVNITGSQSILKILEFRCDVPDSFDDFLEHIHLIDLILLDKVYDMIKVVFSFTLQRLLFCLNFGQDFSFDRFYLGREICVSDCLTIARYA